MASLADWGLAPQSPAPTSGLGAPGWQNDPSNPNNPNSADFQSRFAKAADSGLFSPGGVPPWLTAINQQVSQAYGNNNQAYDGAYSQAMQVARSNVQQQIGNALSEIAGRQGSANQGLQQLPGQFTQNYDQANQTVNSAVSAIKQQEASIGGAGGQSTFQPGAAAAEPGLAAIAASNAGAQSGVPVLQLAFDNAFSNQRQQTQDAGNQKVNDLNLQEAQHNASLAESLQTSKQDATRSLILQHYAQQAADDKSSQDAAAKAAGAAAAAWQKVTAASKPGYNGDTGKALVKYLPDVAASIKTDQGRTGQAYRDAYSQLQQFQATYGGRKAAGNVSKDPAQNKASLVAWDKAWNSLTGGLKKTYPKQDNAINVALYDAGA